MLKVLDRVGSQVFVKMDQKYFDFLENLQDEKDFDAAAKSKRVQDLFSKLAKELE